MMTHDDLAAQAPSSRPDLATAATIDQANGPSSKRLKMSHESDGNAGLHELPTPLARGVAPVKAE